MRTKDTIALERAYSLVSESRAAGTEASAAGEKAKAVTVEKTLIKAITEDLNATATHLETIQPLMETFEEGEFGEEFQSLMKAVQAVQAAAESLQGRMTGPEEELPMDGGDMGEDMPPDEPMM